MHPALTSLGHLEPRRGAVSRSAAEPPGVEIFPWAVAERRPTEKYYPGTLTPWPGGVQSVAERLRRCNEFSEPPGRGYYDPRPGGGGTRNPGTLPAGQGGRVEGGASPCEFSRHEFLRADCLRRKFLGAECVSKMQGRVGFFGFFVVFCFTLLQKKARPVY